MAHTTEGGGGSGLRSSANRASDWSPLGYGADPVPGDAQDVLGEAGHYAMVASEISSQAERLRRLAHPDDALKGDYTAALQDSCDELADDVSKAYGRFEEVSSQLYVLAPALDDAMWETAQALETATEAQGDIDRVDATSWTWEERTDPEDPRHAAYLSDQRVRAEASSRLEAARLRAQRAVSTYDGVASRVASRIRAASDDQLKDGRFDGVKAWVKKHAAILKQIAQVLGAIVLVLAVAIVLLTNPAGWLVLAAIVAGAALLTVDTLLAMSGEGSWLDVGLDVLGLLTLGAGSVVAKLAKGARSLTLFRGGTRSGFSAAQRAFNGTFARAGRLRTVAAHLNPANYARGASAAVHDFGSAFRSIREIPVVATRTRSPLMTSTTQAMVDDLAMLSERLGPSSVAQVHADAVRLLRGVDAVGNVNGAVTAALYGIRNLPQLDTLEGLIDRFTVVELGGL